MKCTNRSESPPLSNTGSLSSIAVKGVVWSPPARRSLSPSLLFARAWYGHRLPAARCLLLFCLRGRGMVTAWPPLAVSFSFVCEGVVWSPPHQTTIWLMASSPPAEHRMPHVNRCRGLNLKALRSSHAVNLRALKSHWALIGLSMRAPRVHGFVRFCF